MKQQQAKANQKHHQLLNYYYTLTQIHTYTRKYAIGHPCAEKPRQMQLEFFARDNFQPFICHRDF